MKIPQFFLLFSSSYHHLVITFYRVLRSISSHPLHRLLVLGSVWGKKLWQRTCAFLQGLGRNFSTRNEILFWFWPTQCHPHPGGSRQFPINVIILFLSTFFFFSLLATITFEQFKDFSSSFRTFSSLSVIPLLCLPSAPNNSFSCWVAINSREIRNNSQNTCVKCQK